VPAAQAGWAAALLGVATPSVTAATIAQPSKTSWKTDLIIASSSLHSTNG
jgi:hypothetical protein